MPGHHKWSKLASRVKARAGAPERLEERRRRTMREGEAHQLTLAQIRKARHVTQARLAETLTVSQAQVSHWENQPDLYLSTLEKYLSAIGAELELAAIFPDGTRVLLTLEELAAPGPGGPEGQAETAPTRKQVAERRPAMTTKPTDTAVPEETEIREGRYIRRSPDEVARLAEGRKPFDYEEWQQKKPPATPGELAETEEFLRLRDLEREASIAAQADVYLDKSPDGDPSNDSRTEPGG